MTRPLSDAVAKGLQNTMTADKQSAGNTTWFFHGIASALPSNQPIGEVDKPEKKPPPVSLAVLPI